MSDVANDAMKEWLSDEWRAKAVQFEDERDQWRHMYDQAIEDLMPYKESHARLRSIGMRLERQAEDARLMLERCERAFTAIRRASSLAQTHEAADEMLAVLDDYKTKRGEP